MLRHACEFTQPHQSLRYLHIQSMGDSDQNIDFWLSCLTACGYFKSGIAHIREVPLYEGHLESS